MRCRPLVLSEHPLLPGLSIHLNDIIRPYIPTKERKEWAVESGRHAVSPQPPLILVSTGGAWTERHVKPKRSRREGCNGDKVATIEPLG